MLNLPKKIKWGGGCEITQERVVWDEKRTQVCPLEHNRLKQTILGMKSFMVTDQFSWNGCPNP